jgi:hypothetical protein
MIQMPRRSVTRFFIPLIDVLTLLFCIFLLMPFVKSAGEGESELAASTAPPLDLNAAEPKDQARRIEDLRRELERMRKDRAEFAQHLVVRPLEIGRDDGKLYYYAGSEHLEIRNQNDALRLIEQHRRDLRQKGGEELYYLILYPRSLSGYPTERQIRDYERWFKGVAHGYDNPRAAD